MDENCTLTKIYSFSAAHRLNNDKFSKEKNIEIFGKCNNPNGHGHDYYLELTVAGKISDKTGMIIHLDDLDEVANSIIEPLDHNIFLSFYYLWTTDTFFYVMILLIFHEKLNVGFFV